ncbi:undecaprenyl-diphosphate phosphatase [Heliophilum fasciatum]|uniref:Undecaprenyl-diphosphatase n=1 Tax=Heliophilum fasciatum TaxID=35700 RepID=A0A4V2SY69_9FIRM|nr:undecaprenyl-diphosphate phosphatase [Heliophilum fasciatum]MCW2276641.1 undecaprenyl-diphosphatase [Heliophilum fasciatum]TCP68976.1 undecaprenyl-diphosphatase [Heliophilum fasciatum]
MDNLYVIAVILGIIEGLTEFIPVSSTGHLIIAGNLLQFTGERADTFEVFIQLGAILAVVIIYRDLFVNILRNFWRYGLRSQECGFSVIHIAAAITPALGLGFLLHKIIKTYLFSVQTVLIGLVLGAILMLVASRLLTRNHADTLDEVTIRQSFQVGLWQCLSLWPGFSRSGSTIAGAMLSGMTPSVAAEFSFIIAVPVMIAATGYDMLKSYDILTVSDIPVFATGFLVSFFVAWLAIVWFLKLLRRIGLTPFAIYRIVIAGLFWLMISMQIIKI